MILFYFIYKSNISPSSFYFLSFFTIFQIHQIFVCSCKLFFISCQPISFVFHFHLFLSWLLRLHISCIIMTLFFCWWFSHIFRSPTKSVICLFSFSKKRWFFNEFSYLGHLLMREDFLMTKNKNDFLIVTKQV